MSIKQGSNLIAGSGGGVSNIDNLTITENANEEIQTVGVINSRDSLTVVKTWTGTKAQYDALLKAAHTMYAWEQGGIFVYTEALRPNDNDPVYDSSYHIISKVIHLDELGEDIYIFLAGDAEIYGRPTADDSTTTIYENRIDPNTLYNITDTGEIYLGSTILSNYGANTDLSNLTSTGESHFAKPSDLTSKANTDYSNCSYTPMRSDVKHITETYVSGKSWYRVWSDGWCEQGGQATGNNPTIYFLKNFKNTNYTVVATFGGSGEYNANIRVHTLTTNSFKMFVSNYTGDKPWLACGYIS